MKNFVEKIKKKTDLKKQASMEKGRRSSSSCEEDTDDDNLSGVVGSIAMSRQSSTKGSTKRGRYTEATSGLRSLFQQDRGDAAEIKKQQQQRFARHDSNIQSEGSPLPNQPPADAVGGVSRNQKILKTKKFSRGKLFPHVFFSPPGLNC